MKTLCEEICSFGFEGDTWNQKEKDQVEVFLKGMFAQLKAQLNTRSKCFFWRAALAFRQDYIKVAYSHLSHLCECPGSAPTEDVVNNDSLIGELSPDELKGWLDYCTGEYQKGGGER